MIVCHKMCSSRGYWTSDYQQTMQPESSIPRRKVLKVAGISGAVVVGGVGAATANGDGSKAENSKINQLRRATAKYHNVNRAVADGYVEDPHCVADPELGGMGYHYIDSDRINESVNETNPEALVYEKRGGKRHLVAVEFLANGAEPPTLFGHEFHPFQAPIADWELHVWAWKDNPSGLFADFNPRVECSD